MTDIENVLEDLAREFARLNGNITARNKIDCKLMEMNEKREIRTQKLLWALFLLNAILCGANIMSMTGVI